MMPQSDLLATRTTRIYYTERQPFALQQLRLLSWYLVFVLIILALGALLAFLTFRLHWTQIEINQAQLLQVLANRDSESAEELIAQFTTENDFVLRQLDNQLDLRQGQAVVAITNIQTRWYRRILFEIARSDGGAFIRRDPDDQLWLFFSFKLSDASRLLLQRPLGTVFQILYFQLAILTGLILLVLLTPLILWQILQRQFINQYYELSDISEGMRWRGTLQADEREQLKKLIKQNTHTSILAQALLDMEQEISQRFLQLSTIINASQAVTLSLNIEEVLDTILIQVQRIFKADRCSIITLNESSQTFRIRASHGLSESYVNMTDVMPSEFNSPAMRALRNRAPVQIANIETDIAYQDFRQRAQSAGIHSVMAIPLMTQRAPAAVLLLYKNSPYHYSYSERELAINFGNQAALALENAELYSESYKQLQIQRRRLDAIVESLTEPLILENQNREIIYMNSHAKDLFGSLTSKSLTTDIIEHLFSRYQTAASATETYHQAYHQAGEHSVDIMLQSNTYESLDMRVHFFEVQDAQGETLGRGQHWQDVSKDKQIDRMRSALVSTVSHELRTPLATIKGYVTSLLAEDVQWQADVQHDFLATISQETDRLAKLVTDILDISQIEAGLLKITRESISINELASSILSSFPPQETQRIHLELDAAIPLLALDATRIATVMRNLIDNAIKYAPDSPIDVYTRCKAKTILFAVRDYGEGIPKAVRDHIFDRFYRYESVAHRTGGFGLGLSICAGFIEAHQGKMTVNYHEQGVEFAFELPID